MKSPCQGFGRQSWVSMSSAHLGVSLLMSLLTVTSALAPSTPGYWKTMHPAEQCRTHLRTSRPVDKALTHQPRGMRMSAQESQRSRAGTLERPQSIDVASHAESLRDRGFTVLSKNCVDAAVIQSARELSRNTLATLLDKVKAAGCDPFEQQYRFKEIASRQRYRWDLQLQDPAQGLDDSTWSELCRQAMAVATPIIREEQGEAFKSAAPVMIGAVISRPGARVQRFHCDASHEHFAAAKVDAAHRLYNVFIPLVDIRPRSDGTEFWSTPDLEQSTLALARIFLGLFQPWQSRPSLPSVAAQVEAPACESGGIIIYDYRTIHRGLPNPSDGGRERAVAYVIVATGGATEGYNFLDVSVDNPDPNVVGDFPFYAALQGRGRNTLEDSLEYSTEIQGPDRFAIPIEFSLLKWGYGAIVSNLASSVAKLFLSFETKA